MIITPDGAQKSTFVAAVSEGNPEALRPPFDFTGTMEAVTKIDEKIRQIRHARNV